MTDDTDEIERRRKELREMLLNEAHIHDGAARKNEFGISAFFYASLIFGALAVGAGLLKQLAIPTEIISLLAAIGTGSTLFSREAKFRAKADWFYSVRDTARDLIYRLDYEMPIPITRDDIASISEEWRKRRSALGFLIAKINGSDVQSSDE